MNGAQPDSTDPVRNRREQIQLLVDLGQRIGYTLFLAAIAAFVIGFFVGFSTWIVNMILGALVIGSFVLAPAIVFGYAVKAADRLDDERGWGPGTAETVRRPPDPDIDHG